MRDREKNGLFGGIIYDLNDVNNKIKGAGLGNMENKKKISLQRRQRRK